MGMDTHLEGVVLQKVLVVMLHVGASMSGRTDYCRYSSNPGATVCFLARTANTYPSAENARIDYQMTPILLSGEAK